MTQQTSSVADLDNLADKELARLARISQVDVRSELEQHVWPFFKELLALYESEDEHDGSPPLPAETAGRILGMITILGQLAQRTLPPEDMQQIGAEIEAVIEEVLSFVDPDEWASFVAQIQPPPTPAATPPAPQAPTTAELPRVDAAVSAPAPSVAPVSEVQS